MGCLISRENKGCYCWRYKKTGKYSFKTNKRNYEFWMHWLGYRKKYMAVTRTIEIN
jgi:hypothetical protein